MVDWVNLFHDISEQIRLEVRPLFGSDKAREAMGRGAGGDISQYIDLRAEEIVIHTLESQSISCILVSEESGRKTIGDGSGGYVVLDSIDGTTNATRGVPFSATSLAHAVTEYLTSVDAAMVRDLYRGVTFSAVKGRGAFEDGKRLSPSAIASLGEAIVAVDLGPREQLAELIHRVLPVLSRAWKLRHLGSTALEVCYVAAGALDVFLDLRELTRATDLAAAYLVLQETGGSTVTPRGEELNMRLRADARTSFISTSNMTLRGEVLTCLEKAPKG